MKQQRQTSIKINESCYLIDQQTHQKVAWKLMWQDNFDSLSYTNMEWDLSHETRICSGIFGYCVMMMILDYLSFFLPFYFIATKIII